jgi:large subunit ribosomal protein L2
MGIRIYRPTSAGRRHGTVNDYSELTGVPAAKSLCVRIRKNGGRNHHGNTTSRFRGGGARRIYRLIDFKRNKDGIPAKVSTVEYDPNRGCFISLLNYLDGQKRYILAPLGLSVGDTVVSGPSCEPKTGNAMPLEVIPSSLEIHNIEMIPGQGGKLARGAGNAARIIAKEGKWVTVLLPSGEMRMLRKECRATIGRLSNPERQNIRLGKAGRKRHLGRRPHVRGKAMNPVAHPMGGGEGRANGGRNPCSPTGLPAKGGKTRNPRKPSNKRIIRRRKNVRQGQLVL